MEAGLAAGLSEAEAASIEACYRARLRMYLPGGPMALELSKNATVLVVNDTAFAHGGLLPMHGAPPPLPRARRPSCPSLARAVPRSLSAPPPLACSFSVPFLTLSLSSPRTPAIHPAIRAAIQSSTGWSA